jgi:hypothetical protein
MKVLFDYGIFNSKIKVCPSTQITRLLKEYISFDSFTDGSISKALQSFTVAEDLNEKYHTFFRRTFVKIKCN